MITLQPLTYDIFEEIIYNLKVAEHQKNHVLPNVDSIAWAYAFWLRNGYPPITFGVFAEDIPVGYAEIFYMKVNKFQNGDEKPFYYISRYMIDEKHQGKGYGKEALLEIIKHIKTMPSGIANSIYLSCEPDNDVARKLYTSLDFIETGEIYDDEIVMRLDL